MNSLVEITKDILPKTLGCTSDNQISIAMAKLHVQQYVNYTLATRGGQANDGSPIHVGHIAGELPVSFGKTHKKTDLDALQTM